MATLPDGFEHVTLTPHRLRDVLELEMWAFPTADSLEELLNLPSPLTWERTHAVVKAGQPERLVAMRASYPFGNCPVPGGRTRIAGLTWVGVHPEYRRRGLLTAMMTDHFQRCSDRDEPVSMLTASEPGIYGRFGYGLAALRLHLQLKRRAALRPVPGADAVSIRFETVSFERHNELVGQLHSAVDRPGWVTRETRELAAVWLSNAPLFNRGREVDRILIAERGGEPVGYALFRRKGDWGDAGAQGTVHVAELVATDPAAARAMWSRLLDLDLTTEVNSGMLPVDDALPNLLVDVRAARPTLKDNLWVRIVDVPAALLARQYQTDIDVVLDVRDSLLPDNAGRWRLVAPAFGAATVERTNAPAALALDVRELGAAYLGGKSLCELASAGLVDEIRNGSLLRTSTAFGWPVAPGSSWIF